MNRNCIFNQKEKPYTKIINLWKKPLNQHKKYTSYGKAKIYELFHYVVAEDNKKFTYQSSEHKLNY